MTLRHACLRVVPLVLLAGVLALTRCGSGNGGGGGGADDAGKNVLYLSYPDDPDTLNVLTGNDTTGEDFQRWVYEPLAERSFSDPEKLENVLAESWTFDEETLTFRVKLKKGVKWHPMKLPDGTALQDKELTASDVKFTFDVMLNKHVQATHIRSYFEDFDEAVIVDPLTIDLRWKKPYFLADEFTLGMDIIPRHVFSVDERGEPYSLDVTSKEFAEGFNNHWANRLMCGTGPLKFVEWKKGDRVVLDRNDDYYGKKFFFDRVVFRGIVNENTRYKKALAGEIDFERVRQKDLWMQAIDEESVKNGSVRRERYEYPVYRYVGYNVRKPFFSDPMVRRALSHAVPIEQIIDKVLFGLAERVTGPFQVGSPANDESIPAIPYDLEAAAKLLDEAGWKDSDGDGVRDKVVNGVKVQASYDLMTYSDNTQYRTIGEIIKENNRKLGIDTTVTPTKWALMLQKLRKKEFDAAMLGWALGWVPDPYQIWHGSQAELPDSSNSIGYANPEVDALIEQLRTTMSAEARTPIYHRIHRLIYDDQPYTFLFSDNLVALLNDRIRDPHGSELENQTIRYYKIRPCWDAREWYSTRER